MARQYIPVRLPSNATSPSVLITAIKPCCAKEIVRYKPWIMWCKVQMALLQRSISLWGALLSRLPLRRYCCHNTRWAIIPNGQRKETSAAFEVKLQDAELTWWNSKTWLMEISEVAQSECQTPIQSTENLTYLRQGLPFSLSVGR